MNLIGIGNTGCNIVDKFKAYPQYGIYKIDHDLEGLKKDGEYNFPRFDAIEDYEELSQKCERPSNVGSRWKGSPLCRNS